MEHSCFLEPSHFLTATLSRKFHVWLSTLELLDLVAWLVLLERLTTDMSTLLLLMM